ncbi:PREDICTED: odorant receptor 82a-like [Polistes dominula]|uniref:Odorant receptor n=1 Tax=Polistes dominula TaxID=743375 RepID=A0ABM1JB30_POLDO|nr:PREDICTED: odorant receptor 82a-like [Polistes dominula]
MRVEEKYAGIFYDDKVLTWSKRLLTLPGLWPEDRNDFRFFFYVIYVILFTSLELVGLFQSINDLDKTLRNVTLSLPTILIVLKALMFRWKMHLVLPILKIVRRDISQGLYRTDKEREKIVWYNVAATMFTTSSAMSLFFVPTLFYGKPIFECILSGFDNCTLPYELPIRINHIYEVTDARKYALFCIWLIPASTLLTVGATGADSLLVTLTFYLCGQLSILGNRLKNVNLEMGKYHCEMKHLIDRHDELLRLATILKNAFSFLMFVQTLGLICSLCVVAYQLLTTSENGKDMNTVHFVLYSCAVVLLAFCYCFLGECLIEESSAIDLACYFTNWYELPTKEIRSMMFCIARSRRPSYITAGQFYVFSLETFAIIMKASMAYLSVLRTIA